MSEKTVLKTRNKKVQRTILLIVLVLVFLGIVAIALYQIPAIHTRFYPIVIRYKAKLVYFFNPPSKSVFEPGAASTLDADTIATLSAIVPTATPTLEPSPTLNQVTLEIDSPIEPSTTPTPTTIPMAVTLEGIVQEYQRFNACGPANLALALRYWGWKGEQTDIEAVIKPTLQDLNVFPEELVYYIKNHTNLEAVMRFGGDLDMLKKIIAAGFPVLIERGYINRDEKNEDGWMGHYGVVDAYDDAQGKVHIPDTFNGYIWITYERLQADWDEFAGLYIVIFEPQDEMKVMDLLGEQKDEAYNIDYTLEKFRERLETAQRHEKYFVWQTIGELLVRKKEYVEAAKAFDEAFAVYGWLPLDDRPWRMLWYQIGPYEAYYYTGRYDDVIRLAYKTVTDTASPPGFPETFLWSGRANLKLGNTGTAIFEFKRALQYHPGWEPALAELEALGVEP